MFFLSHPAFEYIAAYEKKIVYDYEKLFGHISKLPVY